MSGGQSSPLPSGFLQTATPEMHPLSTPDSPQTHNWDSESPSMFLIWTEKPFPGGAAQR